MKYNQLVNTILESPDSMFAANPDKSATFFVFEKLSTLSDLLKENAAATKKATLEAKKDSSMSDLDTDKLVDDWFKKVIKIPVSSSAVFLQKRHDNKIYLNNKFLIKNPEEGMHSSIIRALVNSLLVDFKDRKYATPGNPRERYGSAGRLSFTKKQYKDFPTPIVSFWTEKPSKKILQILIKNTSKILKWPENVYIEYASEDAFLPGSYVTGDIEYISTSGKKKAKSVSQNLEPNSLMDKFLKRKFPGLKFEQIIESLLKEK
jgi:hypothetical protein